MTYHADDIELAARAMTDVEPPADLEQKIKHRLDASTRTRPTTWRWPTVAGLAAVGAMVLVVVMQSPDATKSRSPEVPGVPGSRGSEVAGVQSLGPVTEPLNQRTNPGPGTVSNPGPQVSQPIRLPAYRSMSASEAAWMSRRVEALDLIDPIQPERVSITPLTMTPLMTSPRVGDPDEGR